MILQTLMPTIIEQYNPLKYKYFNEERKTYELDNYLIQE